MNSRLAAETRGRRSETLAAWALRLKGYRILGRRLKTPLGEIDIVARRGGVVAIVEVKARRTGGDAAEAVSPRQQQRLVRAATAFLGRHGNLAGLAVRFDVMLVRPWRWPEHLADAWRPDGWCP